MKYLETFAQISECQKYRYTLHRVWDESLPAVAFVGLNPSTADASQDDPTIRRCVRFASDAGFGTLVMLNVWAYRSTDPKRLPLVITDEERENAATISRVSEQVARVVGCWGAHAQSSVRVRDIYPLVDRWWCLGVTKEGHPRHPLYVPASQPMLRYERVRKGVAAIGQSTPAGVQSLGGGQ